MKDFLTQYNSLINEMTSLFNAPTAKGYEPLSDEEKKAMSEKEVEQWEQKIRIPCFVEMKLGECS